MRPEWAVGCVAWQRRHGWDMCVYRLTYGRARLGVARNASHGFDDEW
jgi:hypothetical protein